MRERAIDKKISEILAKGETKFIGGSVETLKAEINLMPHFKVVVF